MNASVIVTTLLASAALAQGAAAATQPRTAPSKARITMSEARATALKARPGLITDAELERENGGSGLRYSFDIKAAGRTFEVGVDAKTGAVLEDKAEGANPD